MKKLEETIYKTRFPHNNEEYFNSLSLEGKSEYLLQVSYYHNYLMQFLIKNCQLDTLDNIFVKSKNNFCAVSLDKMDLYQYLCSEYLKYLYIRNNLYIERLTPDEKQELNSIIAQDDGTLSDEAIVFIQKTINKVLSEEVNSTTLVNFGPSDSISYFAPANALVIGVRFDDYQDFDDDDWADKNFAREQELEFALQYIESAISHKLNIDTKVIRYNDNTIKELPNTNLQNNLAM